MKIAWAKIVKFEQYGREHYYARGAADRYVPVEQPHCTAPVARVMAYRGSAFSIARLRAHYGQREVIA